MNTSPEVGKESLPSLRDFMTVLFKRKFGIFVLFLIIVSMVTVYTYTWPHRYEASAKILVKFNREYLPLSAMEPASRQTVTMRSAEEDIRTELEILNNKPQIQELVTLLWDDLTRVSTEQPTTLWAKLRAQVRGLAGAAMNGVYELGYRLQLIQRLSPYEAKVKEVEDNLEVEAIDDSNVIRVSYSSCNPELCAKVVSTLTDRYLKEHIEVHRTPRAHDFFSEQKAFLQEELGKQETELKNFKRQWSISAIDVQRNLLLENVSSLEMLHKALLGEVEETEKRAAGLRTDLSARTNYKDTEVVSPAVIAADPVYRKLETEMLGEEAKLKGLRAKAEAQEGQLKYYKGQIRVLDDKELQLERMEREVRILNDSYRRYVDRVEDTRISEALDLEQISNVSVIEQPTVPFEPVRMIPFIPTRILHICIGICVGLVVGLGYAFLAEQMDHTFGSREDVERILDVPCLASIPRE